MTCAIVSRVWAWRPIWACRSLVAYLGTRSRRLRHATRILLLRPCDTQRIGLPMQSPPPCRIVEPTRRWRRRRCDPADPALPVSRQRSRK